VPPPESNGRKEFEEERESQGEYDECADQREDGAQRIVRESAISE
jgi:hypothetical protein